MNLGELLTVRGAFLEDLDSTSSPSSLFPLTPAWSKQKRRLCRYEELQHGSSAPRATGAQANRSLPQQRPELSIYLSTATPPQLATLKLPDTVAYLERIGLPASTADLPSSLSLLAKLSFAHQTTTPYGSSSLHVTAAEWEEPSTAIVLGDGQGMEMGRGNFERIVLRRGGGHCIALNPLFASLLRGFRGLGTGSEDEYRGIRVVSQESIKLKDANESCASLHSFPHATATLRLPRLHHLLPRLRALTIMPPKGKGKPAFYAGAPSPSPPFLHRSLSSSQSVSAADQASTQPGTLPFSPLLATR